MNPKDSAVNSLNAKRFEGESLRLQMNLEAAMAASSRTPSLVDLDLIELAIEAGADPTAYPIGPMKDRWFGQADSLRGVVSELKLQPDRCTLLGNVALSFPSAKTDKCFATLLRTSARNIKQGEPSQWKSIPAAYADSRGEEVSLLEIFFDRENFRRVSEIRPNTACVEMLRELIERLDKQSVHIRWEMREAASAALARLMDSSASLHRQGLLDERHTAGYDAFGLLVTAGATLNDDLSNKAIKVMLGQSHVHVPLLTAASMPHPGATIRSWKTHDLMERLIEGEAKIDARSMGGKTALMCASLQGDAQAVAILLRHGADASIKDNRRWTAETYAKQSQDDGGPQVLALLQAHKVRSVISQVRAGAAPHGGRSS